MSEELEPLSGNELSELKTYLGAPYGEYTMFMLREGVWPRLLAAAARDAVEGLLAEVAEHLPVVTPEQRARLARIDALLKE